MTSAAAEYTSYCTITTNLPVIARLLLPLPEWGRGSRCPTFRSAALNIHAGFLFFVCDDSVSLPGVHEPRAYNSGDIDDVAETQPQSSPPACPPARSSESARSLRPFAPVARTSRRHAFQFRSPSPDRCGRGAWRSDWPAERAAARGAAGCDGRLGIPTVTGITAQCALF